MPREKVKSENPDPHRRIRFFDILGNVDWIENAGSTTPFIRVPESPASQLRIVLYSHDTMGLGHLRRNMLIAKTLSSSPLQANILMISGSNVTTAFDIPSGVDCLTLPAVCKKNDGSYQSRSLGLSIKDIIAFRSKTICSAIEAFEPDVLIVDGVPRGLNRELNQTLEYLRLRGNTLCILGLREVLDEPETIRKEWQMRANEESIRDFYDAVWIYGDRTVYDVVREYRFSRQMADKVRYTGYFDRRSPAGAGDPHNIRGLIADLGLPPGRLVLCMSGGGQDGSQLVDSFSRAHMPDDFSGVILTGPFMPAHIKKEIHARARQNHRLRVMEFHPEPTRLLGCADRVISMGGYNTVSEILSFEKRALVVPRVSPRREQMIRAERLNKLGVLDICHPDQMSPGTITHWLENPLLDPPKVHGRIDFGGLSRLPTLLRQELSAKESKVGKPCN
ncbi:MAG: glycosyltransferase family protein [Nitrospinaceae bacterium]